MSIQIWKQWMYSNSFLIRDQLQWQGIHHLLKPPIPQWTLLSMEGKCVFLRLSLLPP